VNLDTRWLSVHRDYLTAVYELGELKDRNGVSPAEILKHLHLNERKADQVLEFLVGAGMVVWPAKGVLLLTERGLRKAQELEAETGPPVITSLPEAPAPNPYRPRRLPAGLGRLTRA